VSVAAHVGASTARPAVRWASATLLVSVVVLVVGVLVRTHGTFVYVLDDPAIHLTIARRLAFDGTWGVVAGDFQSASSSPLWVIVLAPTQWLVRGDAGELVPLVLNVAAGLVVIRQLGPDLGARLQPSRERPWDAVAVSAVVVGPLFLPGLAFVGMEHTLHMALVLALVLVVERRWGTEEPDGGRRWVPFALAALAGLTRAESVFVVAGLGVALMVVRPSSQGLRLRLAVGAGLVAAVAAALGAVAALNLAFGQELLPDSVMAKSFGDRGDTRRSVAAAAGRLARDPWLLAVVVVALLVIVAAWRGRGGRALFPAVVALVTVLLHVELAAVDASLRYEAYIAGLGTLVVLRALADLPATSPRRRLRLAPAALVVPVVVLAGLQLRNTARVPFESGVLWEQRYQVARFLDRDYRHDPIAIGELGYIGLYHDGPLTDVYGLADHQVLEAALDGRRDDALWRRLQRERGFRVVATYDFSLGGEVPDGWIPVASWRSPDAVFEVTVFWATVPDEVGPLQQRLRAYEPELPDSVEVTYNDLAQLAAASRRHEALRLHRNNAPGDQGHTPISSEGRRGRG
jgi:hypothetical protein